VPPSPCQWIGRATRTRASSSEKDRRVTYHLASPVDGPTAEALQQAIESRFFYFGAADAQVRVDGTAVSVTTTRPIDQIDQLVTLPGGLDVWPVIGDVSVTPKSCDPPGPDGSVVIRPTMADPSRCVRVAAEHRQIVAGFAAGAGYELDPDGSYRVDVSLGPVATQALIDALGPPAGSDGSAARIVVVAADTGFFLAFVTIDLTTPSAVLKIHNFPNADEAARWASILSHPLPDGATFQS